MLEKRYSFKEKEPAMQQYWAKENIYRYDPKKEGPRFSIDTPPPTVSGSLHIGHLFSYTQAEIIARYQRMLGKNVFYPFGFDDNGLPTERLVEKEEGLRAGSLSRSAFIEKCMAIKEKYEEAFKSLWKSLGFSVDWSLQYETVSPRVMKISQRSFLELAKSGKAYDKEAPVLWCPHCRTSIAQAELDSVERETLFSTLAFKSGGASLPVATTRPELLFGCVALFVHPEDEHYRSFIGKEALVPLYDFTIPILANPSVDRDKGTGLVMCATFGDMADLEWYNTYGLPYKKAVTPDGRLDETVPLLGGLTVADARKEALRLLSERGQLLSQKPHLHHVGVHERCGQDTEIIPSRQWYISVLPEKERFLKAADEINWYPQAMKTRYTAWVENLKWDWCISRQRFFGVPFPVWYCESCGKPLFAREEDLPVNPLETPPHAPCSCGHTGFIPESAVMDTWATSSLTPFINSHWGDPEDFTGELVPMSLRTQAHEIIRTWAFYTIVKSLYHTGRLPWRDLMVCGFVLAKKGEKISKSKGNGSQSPDALVSRHSADVLRYWSASSRLGTDTFFAEEDLKIASRFLTKLWNAARFTLFHLDGFSAREAKNAPPSSLSPSDAWIIARFQETERKAAALLDAYEVGSARQEMDAFFWKDYCDTYLELVKERLYAYKEPKDQAAPLPNPSASSAHKALYLVFQGILRLYAPFVPHMTEHIYLSYYQRQETSPSLHLTRWFQNPEKGFPMGIMENGVQGEESLLNFGNQVKAILFEARKYKTERGLSMKDPLPALLLTLSERDAGLIREARADLLACTGAKDLLFQYAEEGFSLTLPEKE